MNLNRTSETKAVIEKLGGVTRAAKSLGLTAAAVSKWSTIPAKYDARIVELTGKTREQIAQAGDTPTDGTNT